MASSAGLCSVTLRALAPDAVVAHAAAAGLDCVEWGGDVHVPPGEVARAAEVGVRTRDAGLRVASYGSYHRALDPTGFDAVLASAVALGAPRIRIWAGSRGSAAASEDDRAAVVAGCADAVRRAAAEGLEIGLEWHGGTLTDTPSSTAALLRAVDDEVGAQTLTTYWQPAVDVGDDDALDGLEALLPRISTVHVFSWWPGTARNRLSTRESLWRRVITTFAGEGDRDFLLEFLPGDDVELLRDEAGTLRTWLNR